MFIMNNYHTHTALCGHAQGTIEEMVKTAIQEGYQSFGISEHVPFPHLRSHLIKALPHSIRGPRSIASWLRLFIKNGPHMRMPYRLKNDYIKEIQRLKQQYQDQINLYVGFECEYFEEYIDYYRSLLDNHEVDYLIFGNHYHIYTTSPNYFGANHIDQAMITSYVDDALKAFDTGLFHYMAHPDLIFTGYHHWDEFVQKECRRLLEACKQHDMILEVNGGGHNRQQINLEGEMTYPYPIRQFFELVSEYDIPVILGMDSHAPSQLRASLYHELEDFASRCHLKIVDGSQIVKNNFKRD